MARPVVIRDETIVEAAREVFLARGFQATTAEVAERAGVSEGSIFKRFKSKFELFQAAMQADFEQPAFTRGLVERVGQGDLRENLYQLGAAIVDHLRAMMPLMMMSWSTPDGKGNPCLYPGGNDPAPVRILRDVAGYLEAEMRLQRMRRHDPEILARVFLGAIGNFLMFELVFRSHEKLPMPTETFLRGLVQLVWTGAAPVA